MRVSRQSRKLGSSSAPTPRKTGASIGDRVAALDWARIERDLDAQGYATTGAILRAVECAEMIALYPDRERFRSRVVMERHSYGVGEYKYFARPMPPLGRGAARRDVSQARAHGESMGRADALERFLSTFARGISESLRRSRTDAADAADPSLRGWRLQLPASGFVRRGRVPAAVHLRAKPARTRLRRRRTFARRAAPAGAIARRGDRARCRRRNNLRESLPSRRRRKGIPSREHASRRQHDQIRRCATRWASSFTTPREPSEPAYGWSSAGHLPSVHAQVAPSLSVRYLPQKSSQAVRLSSVP